MSVEERFWLHVDKTNSCWNWQLSKNSDGYGNFCHDSKIVKAHIFAYTLENKISPGMQLDHLCRNRACVNPDHLEQVSQVENLKRGIYWQREKTHCKHGHEFTGENTYITKEGWRNCRRCAAIRSRVIRSRKS